MTGILCSLPLIGAPTSSSSGISPVAVTLSPASVSASGSTSSLTTSSVTATASGGTAPYTYAWSLTTGDATTTATAPSLATTAFQRTGCVASNTYNSSWKCTVTDSASNSKLSTACPASIACTGVPAVDWGNISRGTVASPCTSANAAVTVGVTGTLNFSNTVAGSYTTATYKVFKNAADQGQVTSLAVVTTDSVYFQWTMTGSVGSVADGTFTVGGAATDTFTVGLEITG